MISNKSDHHTRTPSCSAVADRLPYPDTVLSGLSALIRQTPGIFSRAAQRQRPLPKEGWRLRSAGSCGRADADQGNR